MKTENIAEISQPVKRPQAAIVQSWKRNAVAKKTTALDTLFYILAKSIHVANEASIYLKKNEGVAQTPAEIQNMACSLAAARIYLAFTPISKPILLSNGRRRNDVVLRLLFGMKEGWSPQHLEMDPSELEQVRALVEPVLMEVRGL